MKSALALALLLPTLAHAQVAPNLTFLPDSPTGFELTVTDENNIVFGMTPVVGVESTRQRFTPLTEHLSRQIGRPVKLFVAPSYGELIALVARGQVHLTKLSPLAYVRARRKIPTLKLLASHVAYGTVTYSSYLVSLQDGQYQTLDKIKDARICFADPDSTSGYLYPAAYIQKTKNLSPKDLNSTFSGSHRACLQDLLKNKYDLATSWAGALRDARQAGLDVGDLTIVAKTGRIPYDAYCTNPDLDPTLTDKIRKTLLETNTLTKQGRRILAPTLGINGWVPAKDKTYDEVRQIESQIMYNNK